MVTDLKSITDVIGDGLHGTPEYDDNGQFFFINGNNLNETIEIKSDTKRVNEKEYNKYKKPLNSDTILLSINGTLGNFARYNNEPVILGKSACYINIKQGYNVDYISWFLKSKVKSDFERNATGTTIKNISLKQIREFQINLPDGVVQEKIAKTLNSIQAKIDVNNKINRNLWDQIDSWFYKLYTSDNVVSMKFGDVVTRCSEKVKDDIVKVLSPVSTGEIVLSEDFFTKQVFSNDIGKYLKVNPFEYCYNPARANIGSIGMNDFEFAGCVSPVYVVFKTTDVLRFYISRYFKTDNFKAEVIIRSSGSVRQALRYEDLVQIEFRKPLDFELEEFNEFYLGLKMQIESLKKENERLSDLRDCMLPRLMSGELDVSELDI